MEADQVARSTLRPMIIAIYGIAGCGKTHISNQLRQLLPSNDFSFYDGSEVLAGLQPGGLETFRHLDPQEKFRLRERAIRKIYNECLRDNKLAAIMTGHAAILDAGDEKTVFVWTPADMEIITHMLYLNVAPDVVLVQRQNDSQRQRPQLSIDQLREWQLQERNEVDRICHKHGILHYVFSASQTIPLDLKEIGDMILHFCRYSEASNMTAVEKEVDSIVLSAGDQLKHMLVFDADKTLTEVDTGMMFWKELAELTGRSDLADNLRNNFKRLGYTHAAFHQAMLLSENAAGFDTFETALQRVAAKVDLRPELIHLFQKDDHLNDPRHVEAMLLTSGFRPLTLADGQIIDPMVKAAVVRRLQNTHGLRVTAFGDSPLDLPMLQQADCAIVVVGEDNRRSASMESQLAISIRAGLRAYQVLIPSDVTPRLDSSVLPIVDVLELRDLVLTKDTLELHARFLSQTLPSAAQLLATPMRDANLGGPGLRKAHENAGKFLAINFLTDIIGLEGYSIEHVQNRTVEGFRLQHEYQTLVVALMRGGEPMAFGVNEAFPRARFLHAYTCDDLKPERLATTRTVVLVDSVINTGKSIVEFVQRVQAISRDIRIVVVAGVVHSACIGEDGSLARLAKCNRFDLVALRTSDNQYTGQGTTDTGNRLFNTLHLK